MNKAVISLLPDLNQITGGLPVLAPELVLTGFFALLVLLDLFPSPKLKFVFPYLALLGITIALGFQIVQAISHSKNPLTEPLFFNLLQQDGLAIFSTLLISLTGIFSILLSILHQPFKGKFQGKGEYYAFILVLLIGLNLLVKSVNLLMVFVAIELVSIASYLLVMTEREKAGTVEAGVKYILFGALSAGVMAYGMSFLYGFTGSLNFASVEFWKAMQTINPVAVSVALGLTLVGLLFKIAAAPFQFWAPDVYEGAPTPVVALFATAPKIAGMIVLVRLVLPLQNAALPAYFSIIFYLLGGIALLTLIIGNFTALWQNRPKRMLAYSSVAQAGFMLLLLPAFSETAIPSLLFYLSILLFTSFGIFSFVQVFEDKGGVNTLADYAGLGRIFPLAGICALILLIALTGLPPTAGFTAKLLIFTALWQQYTASGQFFLMLLLGVGLLLTAVSFFYYIRIPFYLFFRRNLNETSFVIPLPYQLLLLFFSGLTLLFFFKADWLLNLIRLIVKS